MWLLRPRRNSSLALLANADGVGWVYSSAVACCAVILLENSEFERLTAAVIVSLFIK